jgi:16S rRNA processing protein RimM
MSAPATSDPADQAPAWVWLARIRHPQGRKGEVFADILTDFPEKFTERHRLWLLSEPAPAAPPRPPAAPLEVELIAHWLHKGGIVLHFAQIDSISAAETLKGLIVAIPQSERAPLADDEVYVADLIGCTLIDVAGPSPVPIGKIEDVDRTAGPVALLVVNSPGSQDEILIPFAKSYIHKIDLAAKRVEMALPEGLVDLNISGKKLT